MINKEHNFEPWCLIRDLMFWSGLIETQGLTEGGSRKYEQHTNNKGNIKQCIPKRFG